VSSIADDNRAALMKVFGGNLAMWALNAYLCRTFTVMFILHALYHNTGDTYIYWQIEW
jgi:hypothetical protein